jgi:hypothetical protein
LKLTVPGKLTRSSSKYGKEKYTVPLNEDLKKFRSPENLAASKFALKKLANAKFASLLKIDL